MNILSDEFISKLKKMAEEDCTPPEDLGDHKHKDLYRWGEQRGETLLSRDILDHLGIEYTIEERGW